MCWQNQVGYVPCLTSPGSSEGFLLFPDAPPSVERIYPHIRAYLIWMLHSCLFDLDANCPMPSEWPSDQG